MTEDMQAKNLEYLKSIKIAIATPYYQVSGFSPFINSLAATICVMKEIGVDFEIWDISGGAYIDDNRNNFARRLLESDRTHLFFIDSDMAWDVQGFINVLLSDVDIVGAAYPCKNNWEFYSVITYTNEDGTPKMDMGTGLIEAWGVPTGFMKIHRSVFEKIKPFAEEYVVANSTNPEDGVTSYNDFYGRIIKNRKKFGEDISFCIRCEDAGIKRWVMPNVTIAHYGVKDWTGNYAEYLMRCPGGKNEGTPA